MLQYNALVVIMLSAASVMSWYLLTALRRRPKLREWLFIAMVAAMIVWTVAYSVQLMSLQLEGKLRALEVVHIAANTISPIWLLFVMVYAGQRTALTPRFVIALFVIPLIAVVLTFTAEHHTLMFTRMSLVEQNGFALLEREFGSWFWVSVVYSYFLIFLASAYLLRRITHQPDIYRGQSMLLFTAMFVPSVTNLLSVIAVGTLRYNLTPLAFVITVTVTAYDLYRLEGLDLQPLGRYSVFENVNASIFLVDSDGYVRDLNPKALAELGTTREQLIGKRLQDFYPGGRIPDELKPFYENTRQPFHTQLTLDGRVYNLDINPVFSRDGERYHGRVATLYDITQLVRAREAEHQQRQFAFALTEAMAALAANLEEGRRSIFTQLIERVRHIVPYDRASITVLEGDYVTFIAHVGYSAEQQRHLDAFREPLTAFARVDKMIDTKEPELLSDVAAEDDWMVFHELPHVASYIGIPIMRGGEVVGILNLDHNTPGFFTTEHIERLRAFAAQAAVALENARLVEDLRRSADELAMRNADLDAFTFTIAHDLSAPLNQLLSLLKTLDEMMREDIDAELRPLFDDTLRRTAKMSTMIRSLLNVARHSADGRERYTSLDLRLLAHEALHRFSDDVNERCIALHIAEEMPPAYGHPVLVEEVLANLIGNAIKYIGKENPNPRIAISAAQQGDEVCISVKDNGIGIHHSHQERIFALFDKGPTPRHSGHGLGLAIVQRLVTRLEGRVGLESTPSSGSRFWFTLPAPPTQ
jgi:PAS domain S-box-containing protein